MARATRVLLPAIFFFFSFHVRAGRFWVAASTSNWNNSANWSTNSGGAGGASVPGPTDAVTFDNRGRGDCVIDADVNIRKLTVQGYNGKITQGANAFTVLTTATFSSGQFAGGTGDMLFGKTFTLSGTTFTSTAGTLEFDGNSNFANGTFNHNNGTVRYVATGGNTTISGRGETFYVLEFAGVGFNYTINSTGTITVINRLVLSGTQAYNLNNGTIDAEGDIDITNIAAGCAGTTLVNIAGTGNQTITGSTVAGAGALPEVTINKTGGTLSLANYPASSNNFTYTAGTINAGTSTWCFTDGSATPYTIRGSLTLNNITFLAINDATFTIRAGTTLTTSGDLTIAGTNQVMLNTGNINVQGNLYLTNAATTGGGSALITINGSGSQAIDGTAISIGQDPLPFLTINKPGGTLTMKGNITESEDWQYLSGAVDASTFSSTTAFGGNALNVTSAGMKFYNVSFTGNTVTLLNNLTATGNLTITGGKLAPGANTINLAGSWSDFGNTGFTEGTSTVNLNGSALQTITTPGGETFANLVINNGGPGIKLFNSTTAGTSLTMTSGNIDLNGNTLTTGLSAINNGTLNYAGGTIVNTGSVVRWMKAGAISGNAGLFPVGTATDYRPLIVTTSAAPFIGGTISVFYTNASTNTAVSIPDGASLVQVRKDLNWTVSEANGLTGGTYNLQIQGTGYGKIGSVADLRLTLANSVTGTAGTNGGTTADPQVNRTGLSLRNLNNSFYLGSVNPVFSSLPLNLLYFRGNLDHGEVDLGWATPSDNDAVAFVVERSRDGAGWTDWQTLVADTGGGVTHEYSIADPTPYPGVAFYRLRQTDAAGKSLYSAVLSFQTSLAASRIDVYPIPATDRITVSFPGPGNFEVRLFNAIGQQVRGVQTSMGSSVTWRVAGLPAGLYFVRVSHDGLSETRTVLIR